MKYSFLINKITNIKKQNVLNFYIDLNFLRLIKKEKFFIYFLNYGFDESYFFGNLLKITNINLKIFNSFDNVFLYILYYNPNLFFNYLL